jgi:hypothetical protein
MPVITLTTDLGTRDHYAGVIKGKILSAVSNAQIIDITHNIEPFNIFHASFVLRNAYPFFPAETIHLVGVDTQGKNPAVLLIEHDGQRFIGTDNGIFSLLWEEKLPDKIYRLKKETTSAFLMSDLVIDALAFWMKHDDLSEIADRVTSIERSTQWYPVLQKDNIRGTIIYFDRFENAICNIRKDEFDRMRQGRNFLIYFRKYNDINIIHTNYHEVEEGEKLCLFNASGYLEIAINKGNAKGLLNLNLGDTVQIVFK